MTGLGLRDDDPVAGKHGLWVCLGGLFRKRLAFDSVECVRATTVTHVMGLLQPTEGLNRTKRRRTANVRFLSS